MPDSMGSTGENTGGKFQAAKEHHAGDITASRSQTTASLVEFSTRGERNTLTGEERSGGKHGKKGRLLETMTECAGEIREDFASLAFVRS